MIKEDNLGHKNKLYLTLYEVDDLLLENCKMGRKAGNFHRIKNKEQRKKKGKKSDWLGLHGQARSG